MSILGVVSGKEILDKAEEPAKGVGYGWKVGFFVCGLQSSVR